MLPKTITTSKLSRSCIKHATKKASRGSVLIDLGPTLWVIMMCLFFPLLDMATVAMRYTFLLGASRDAAQAAAITKTFSTDIDSQNLSAVNTANNQANLNSNSFNGVHLKSVGVNILTTNLSNQTQTRQSTPLSQPADTTNNMYQIEVVLTGDVDPLVTYTGPLFGNVPGLTGPAHFTVATQEIYESPMGLNQ